MKKALQCHKKVVWKCWRKFITILHQQRGSAVQHNNLKRMSQVMRTWRRLFQLKESAKLNKIIPFYLKLCQKKVLSMLKTSIVTTTRKTQELEHIRDRYCCKSWWNVWRTNYLQKHHSKVARATDSHNKCVPHSVSAPLSFCFHLRSHPFLFQSCPEGIHQTVEEICG